MKLLFLIFSYLIIFVSLIISRLFSSNEREDTTPVPGTSRQVPEGPSESRPDLAGSNISETKRLRPSSAAGSNSSNEFQEVNIVKRRFSKIKGFSIT